MRLTRHLAIFRPAHLSRYKPYLLARSIVASLVLASAAAGVLMSPSNAVAKDMMADCTKFADGWKAAYNAKDAKSLAGMYEPEKGTYSNVFWTGTGRAVLVQGFMQELGMSNTMTSIKCDASNATADLVVSSGTWSASGPGPGGKSMTVGGHWQSAAVARNGKYLIVDHTSNMQLPPPK